MYVITIAVGIIQMILIGYILYTEVNKKSPAVFLWATLFLMFGLPHMVVSFTLDNDYPMEVLAKASVFVILFCLTYIAVRRRKECSFVHLSNHGFALKESEVQGSQFELVCTALLIASLIAYMASYALSQGGILNTTWAGGRAVASSYVSLSGLLTRLIFTFSGTTLYCLLTKRRGMALLIVLIFVLMVILTRNRVQAIPVLVLPIAIVLIRIKKIQPKHIIIGAVLAFGAIYIVYALRAFRWMGTLSEAIGNFSFAALNSRILYFLEDQSGELGLRRVFYFFIDNNNQFEGFNRGHTYIRMLLVYLPSRLTFGLKPESFDLTMGRAIGMASGGSYHPTLFGDCFGNLGWMGVFLGAFWSLFCNLVDRIIERQPDDYFRIMIFFLATYAFVVIGRGSVYNGFQVLAWGVLILLIFRILLYRLIKTKIGTAYYQ